MEADSAGFEKVGRNRRKMCSFTYEEQGNKRYLVYEKKPDDSMDILTLEMMSNNRIDGLVPVSRLTTVFI